MTRDEFDAWEKETAKSKDAWTADAIHDGRDGRDLMIYRGGENGRFVMFQTDGLVTIGTYEGAVPHIGDAAFRSIASHQMPSFNEAVTRFAERCGVAFTLTLTHGRCPWSNDYVPTFVNDRGEK